MCGIVIEVNVNSAGWMFAMMDEQEWHLNHECKDQQDNLSLKEEHAMASDGMTKN